MSTVSGGKARSTGLREILVVGLIMLVVTFAAWGDALGGYFIGDDGWHLPLVYRAFNGEPELILKQFFAPYTLRDSLYLMYRPMTDVSYALDFAVWKDNPLGYHITNLLLHVAASCLVFILAKSLLSRLLFSVRSEIDYQRSAAVVIPLAVALLFAVYPGHAEPVCWALPRIDSIASIFTFASLIFSLLFFDKRNRNWLTAATVAMLLGLLTKEMCATIPLLSIALYILLPRDTGEEHHRINAKLFFRKILEAMQLIWPMLLVLMAYLCLRALALGSLLGGYVGSIGAGLNSTYLARLFSPEGYWRLFHPINENILGTNSVEDLFLRCLYFTIAALIIANQSTPCFMVRLKCAGKMLLLLAIMVIPALQIWGVTSGLIGARLAYTLCLPFFLAVFLFIYPICADTTRLVKLLRAAALVSAFATFVLFAWMSRHYAGAWAEATNDVRAVKAQVADEISLLPPEKKLVIMGLPTGIKGFIAFYTIDFLDGVLLPPLTKQDITKRVICIDGTPTNDYVINQSILHDVIDNRDRYVFKIWRQSTKRFEPIDLPTVQPKPTIALALQALGSHFRQPVVTSGNTFYGNTVRGNDLNSFQLTPAEAINPLSAEVLELQITSRKVDAPFWKPVLDTITGIIYSDQERSEAALTNGHSDARLGEYAWLSWSAQSGNVGQEAMPVFFRLYEEAGDRTYLVNLTQFKNWLFSGTSNGLRIDLPRATYQYELKSAIIKSAEELIPKLKLSNALPINSSALFETVAQDLKLDFDASKIPSASGVLVEISKPYLEFHVLPHTFRENKRSREVSSSFSIRDTVGQFIVHKNQIAKPAYYQIRVCALNSDGSLAGSFSDPITISTTHRP
ncbi:MAG: hypothetical protein K2X93_05145 [Candidatus Obscuribacterales bacterium]|nr:hypothetical protein [Candidatus Obscuribacterales bacterium]